MAPCAASGSGSLDPLLLELQRLEASAQAQVQPPDFGKAAAFTYTAAAV